MCSIIGLFASGIIGFGVLLVSGPQAGALTAGQDHGLHGVTPSVAPACERPSRSAARAIGT